MSTYLVTGGAGFIGSHIVEELVKRKEKVIVLDNFSTGKRENLEPFKKEIKIIEGDITDLNILREIFKNVDYVIHLAALTSVVESVNKPHKYNKINVDGTLNILIEAKKHKVKKIVFSSSCAVYGENNNGTLKETSNKKPISPYAVSKLAAEMYCQYYSALHKLPTVNLRYFNVYGPRQPLASRYSAVIPTFITKMLNSESPPVFGDGCQERDFVYVKDVVKATLIAVASKEVNGEVFNVAKGKSYSIIQLVNILNDVLNTNIEPLFESPREGEAYRVSADISKMKSLLDFEPSMSFKEGLRETIEYFKTCYKK